MLLLTKSRCRLAVLCLVFGTLLLPILTPFVGIVRAAGTATWVDQATIDYNGDKYKEDDAGDANWHFRADVGGCPQEIKGFTNPGYNSRKGRFRTQTVTLHKQKSVGNGGCIDDGTEDIQLQESPNGYDVAFVWKDDKNIHSADGKKQFSIQADGTFISVTDGTECKDFLTIGSDKAHPTLVVRSDKGSIADDGDSSLQSKYSPDGTSGWSFVRDIKSTGTEVNVNGKGCHQSNPITVAASTANADRKGTSVAPGAGAGGSDNSCESRGKLAWIVCPFIEMLDGIFNWIDTQIQGLLEVDKKTYNDPKLYKAWSNIRNLAYIILIPVMLVMVIGTALGFQALDAYTVKKALPRMVAAILFISLSWYICGFLISFFNVLGSGVIGVITSPFSLDGHITLADLFKPSAGGALVQTAGVGLVGVAAILVVAANGLIGIVLLYLLGAVLTIFIAFLVLVIRQMFILALLLVAPVAILAWIFPGNDKLWKLWWGTFSKLLMMFPLITGLIGIGRVFASLIATTDAGGVRGGLLNPLLKITAYIVPYVLIPLTFKFAGGAFASLAGMANSRSTGIFAGLKKSRQKQWGKVGHNIKDGRFLRGPDEGRRHNINKRMRRMSFMGQAGLNPLHWTPNLDNEEAIADRMEKKKFREDPRSEHIRNYDNIMRAVALGVDRAGIRIELKNQDDARMKESGDKAYDAAILAGDDEATARAKEDRAKITSSRYAKNPRALEADVAAGEKIRTSYSSEAIKSAAVIAMQGGGTAEKSGARSLMMLAEASGGSSNVSMNDIAEWREAGMKGGQPSQGGGSQGAVFEIFQKLQAGDMNIEEADEALLQAAITSQGAGVLAHPSIKAADVDKIMGGIKRRIQGAVNSGDIDKVDREMAFVHGIQTQLPQAAPQFVDRFAKEIMQMQIRTGELDKNEHGPNNQRKELDGLITVHKGGNVTRREVIDEDPVTRVRTRRIVEEPETRQVREMNPTTGEFETRIEVVPETIEMRSVVTVQQVDRFRSGSDVYNAHTMNYSAGQSQAQAAAQAAAAGPGAAPTPPVTPPI